MAFDPFPSTSTSFSSMAAADHAPPAADDRPAYTADELKAFIGNRKAVWTFTLQNSSRSLTPALKQRLVDGLATFASATTHLDVADIPALTAKLRAVDDKVNAHWARVLSSPVVFADLRFHLRELIQLVFIGYAIDYIQEQDSISSQRAIKRSKSMLAPKAPSQAYDPTAAALDGPVPRRLKVSLKSRDVALDELQIAGRQRARVLDLIQLVALTEEADATGREVASTLQPYLDAGDWKKLEEVLDTDEAIMLSLLKVAKDLELNFVNGLTNYKSNISQIRKHFRERYLGPSRHRLVGTKIEKIQTSRGSTRGQPVHGLGGKLNLKEMWKMFRKEGLRDDAREERHRDDPRGDRDRERHRDDPREERHRDGHREDKHKENSSNSNNNNISRDEKHKDGSNSRDEKYRDEKYKDKDSNPRDEKYKDRDSNSRDDKHKENYRDDRSKEYSRDEKSYLRKEDQNVSASNYMDPYDDYLDAPPKYEE